MKTSFYSFAMLLVAGLAFTACSSDNDEEVATKKYTKEFELKASLPETRALTYDSEEEKLLATWATGEKVYCYHNYKKCDGNLAPQYAGKNTILRGSLTSFYAWEAYGIKLVFPRVVDDCLDYTGQKGTLADIAANYDYATANIYPWDTSVSFNNEQAIAKFNLTYGDGSLKVKSLTISFKQSDEETLVTKYDLTKSYSEDTWGPITITPDAATSEIYAALRITLWLSGNQEIHIDAIGEDNENYEYDITLTGSNRLENTDDTGNPRFYNINVKMKKA